MSLSLSSQKRDNKSSSNIYKNIDIIVDIFMSHYIIIVQTKNMERNLC